MPTPAHHTPVPNLFTTEPPIHISAQLEDGRRVFRILTKSEYIEWQEEGGDLEDLLGDDDA